MRFRNSEDALIRNYRAGHRLVESGIVLQLDEAPVIVDGNAALQYIYAAVVIRDGGRPVRSFAGPGDQTSSKSLSGAELG